MKTKQEQKELDKLLKAHGREIVKADDRIRELKCQIRDVKKENKELKVQVKELENLLLKAKLNTVDLEMDKGLSYYPPKLN